MMLVYITCKDALEAKKIGSHLLNKRLIACANIFPITSMYWWEGKIEEGDEAVLIGKTRSGNYATIQDEVKKLHSYTVPCILKVDADSNPEFDSWILDETK